MKKLISYLVIYFLLSSCEKIEIETQQFSSKQWKSDKSGCNGQRLKMRSALMDVQDLVKGKPESQVVEILGKPDGVDLFKRGQKFFIYQINNPACKADTALPAIYAEIRFNSIDIASELSLVQSNNLK